MSYASIEFYKNRYCGNSIPDDCLQKELDKASDAVDVITRMRIKKLGGINALSEFTQRQVQMAVCCQADYLYSKSSISGVSSYSIGDVSVSVDATSSSNTCGSQCLAYLDSTGLTYRGL